MKLKKAFAPLPKSVKLAGNKNGEPDLYTRGQIVMESSYVAQSFHAWNDCEQSIAIVVVRKTNVPCDANGICFNHSRSHGMAWNDCAT